MPDKEERKRVLADIKRADLARARELAGASFANCQSSDIRPNARRIVFDGKRRKLHSVIKELGLFTAQVYCALGKGVSLHEALHVSADRVRPCN